MFNSKFRISSFNFFCSIIFTIIFQIV
jgi:hypothetical protein